MRSSSASEQVRYRLGHRAPREHGQDRAAWWLADSGRTRRRRAHKRFPELGSTSSSRQTAPSFRKRRFNCLRRDNQKRGGSRCEQASGIIDELRFGKSRSPSEGRRSPFGVINAGRLRQGIVECDLKFNSRVALCRRLLGVNWRRHDSELSPRKLHVQYRWGCIAARVDRSRTRQILLQSRQARYRVFCPW
jgi:hypothetical protein